MYLVLGLSFLIILLCISLTSDMNDIKMNFNTHESMYKVYDNFIDEDEQAFLMRADNLQVLKKLLKWEENNENFEYLICNSQAIQFENHFSEKFSIAYDLMDDLNDEDVKKQYKSLQVNNIFFQHNTINLEKGRLFEDTDYAVHNGKYIPIILGEEYQQFLDINEETKLYYMGVEWNVEVIGFLKENSIAKIDNEVINLDRYVLFPSLNFYEIPQTELDKAIQLRIYLDKTNGYMISEYAGSTLQKELQKECMLLDLQPYGILGVNNSIWGIWGAEEEQLRTICVAFEIVVGGMIVIYITLTNIMMIKEKKRALAILIVNGFSRKQLMFTFSIIYTYRLLFAFLATIFMDFIIFQNSACYLELLCTVLLLGVFSLVGPCYIIGRIKVSISVGGQRYGNTIS